MRTLFFVGFLLVLVSAAFLGCEVMERKEKSSGAVTNPPVQPGASLVDPKAEAQQYQYRAVCTEKEAHGGNEYVLTRWLDSEEKVLPYSREHERKNKGHIVRIETRARPS